MKSDYKKPKRLTVMDLFCGAGGFSEGFRAAGFQIVHGVEAWKAAVDTYNCNFGLKLKPQDILYYENRPDRIEELPDTDVIIGSPPCVSFSFSNKLGNADKTMGIRLMKVFLSIIAVKKHKPGSQLKAWFMENVPNSLKYLQDEYSFDDLGLKEWCLENDLSSAAPAVRIKDNHAILDAADYGVPQARKRLFVHEYLRTWGKKLDFVPPKKTEKVTLHQAVSKLPSPTCKESSRPIRDPLYASIEIPLNKLSDHFYESGAYEEQWRECKYLKTNHPYMGRMSFPENREKPSRTIMANPTFRSRETHLYKSEWGRVGDGEYRMPTVRESATLMSFPITYQFVGKPGAKWKLVGNAVCPMMAQAMAEQLLVRLGRNCRHSWRTKAPEVPEDFINLNTFSPKSYDAPPKRKPMSRFRRHPFKAADIAITLSNYDIDENGAADGRWRCYVTYGTGKGYQVQLVPPEKLASIRAAVEQSPEGIDFVRHVTNGFSEKIPPALVMQKLYEENTTLNGYANPLRLIEDTEPLIRRYIEKDERLNVESGLFLRDSVPKSQLFALFTVCHIAHTAESKEEDHGSGA